MCDSSSTEKHSRASWQFMGIGTPQLQHSSWMILEKSPKGSNLRNDGGREGVAPHGHGMHTRGAVDERAGLYDERDAVGQITGHRRVAQWESTAVTRPRPQVRTLPRLPLSGGCSECRRSAPSAPSRSPRGTWREPCVS